MSSAKERFLQLIPRLSEAQAQAALDAVAELGRAEALRERKAPSIVALTQTCLLMPSQWEGELDDGRSLYVRYRHGLLSVGVGEGAKDAWRNSAPESALCCKQIEDADEDMMSFKELRGHLHGVLEFPDELVVELDPDWGTALAL